MGSDDPTKAMASLKERVRGSSPRAMNSKGKGKGRRGRYYVGAATTCGLAMFEIGAADQRRWVFKRPAPQQFRAARRGRSWPQWLDNVPRNGQTRRSTSSLSPAS